MLKCGVYPPFMSECLLISSQMAIALRLKRHQEAIPFDYATIKMQNCDTYLHRVSYATKCGSARSVTRFENSDYFRTRYDRGRSPLSYENVNLL